VTLDDGPTGEPTAMSEARQYNCDKTVSPEQYILIGSTIATQLFLPSSTSSLFEDIVLLVCMEARISDSVECRGGFGG